ncbi:immunity protein YezG family protein [Spongorhabdus nitratireducens]
MVQEAQKLYQVIGNEAISQIPEEWTKAQIEAEIDDDMSLFDAWYLTAQGEKKMLDVSFELSDSFEKLRNLESMSKKGKWSKCTFVLYANGRFETDFSYDDSPRWKK